MKVTNGNSLLHNPTKSKSRECNKKICTSLYLNYFSHAKKTQVSTVQPKENDPENYARKGHFNIFCFEKVNFQIENA